MLLETVQRKLRKGFSLNRWLKNEKKEHKPAQA